MTISKMEEYKNQMENLLDEMKSLTDQLPHKGDKCEDSQKMCLLQAIFEVSVCLNGLEPSDLESKEGTNVANTDFLYLNTGTKPNKTRN